MSAPPVGWPTAADDDEPQPRAGQPAGGPSAPGGFNTTLRERGQRDTRQSGTATRVASQTAGPAVSVLADRLAAALVHHEPGWRLPRHSALARRYNVSAAEIDAAVEELAGRHLVRRLADGQVYRASPAEYVIDLEGVPGLLSYVDTMGGEFSCRSRQVSWRLPPEDIAWALGLAADQQACVVRYLWTSGGEPAALCTTYVPGHIASRPDTAAATGLPDSLNLLQLTGLAEAPADAAADDAGLPVIGVPAALHIELQAPPPSIARSLRLTAGQPAMIFTVRFDDRETAKPVALTVAVLRPDMFRVVVQTPRKPLPERKAGSLSASWAHVAEDWEP
jgi:DNA-binding GntR family transcriptional regulator